MKSKLKAKLILGSFLSLLVFTSLSFADTTEQPCDRIMLDSDDNVIDAPAQYSMLISNPDVIPYRPIPVEPTGGTPISGAICIQHSQVVGVGANCMVTYEVVSAICQQGWEGNCTPGACANSIGSTYQEVDPLCVIGG